MRRCRATLVCGLCLWSSLLLGRTYVVAPGGNDGNAGTVSSPWRTLAKANEALVPGDTALVRAGTYHERIVPKRSGTSGAPIVFRAYPGELVVVDGPDDTDLTLVAVHGSWIVIEGFTFRNQDYFDLPGREDYWVSIEGSHNVFRYNRLLADGDVFTNIYSRLAASRGIAEAGQHNIIEHCFIRGLAFGIVVAGSSPRYTILRYDTVHATGQNNIDIGGAGDGTTAYHGTLIEYCVLDTSLIEDNIQFEPDYGDPTSTLHNRGTIIRHTIMGNAAENAIDLKGAGHTIIEHNLIYSSSGDDDGPLGGHDAGSGGGVTANPNTPTRNTIVRRNVIWDHCTGLDMAEGDHYYNNTILNNRRTWQGPHQPGETHVALRAFNYPNVKRAFLNNIVAGQSNGGVFDWLMDWGDKFHLDNNLYYDPGAPVRFFHRKNGSIITTVGLGNWKSELTSYAGYGYLRGKDGSALEADPGFVNAPIYATGYEPSWDFSLKSSSPAVDAGTVLTFATTVGSASTSLAVDDAYFFCDGFGITEGDLVRIGSGPVVRVAAIDYSRNLMTLAEPRDWPSGAGVALAYSGNAPDIGAYEAGTPEPPDPQPLPGEVEPISPANGARDVSLQSSLSWVQAAHATSYHLQVSSAASFGSTAVDATGISGTSYPAGALLAGTTYYWRVRGINAAGSGPWSVVRSFATSVPDTTTPEPPQQPPGSVQLNVPADGARDLTLQTSLTWNATPAAVSYHLQVSLTSSFASRAVDKDSLGSTSYPLAMLAGNTTYYWRVRASNRAGFGPWSATRSFTTVETTGGSGKDGSQLLQNGDFENGTQGWTYFSTGAGGFSAAGPAFKGSSAGRIVVASPGDNMQLYQSGIQLAAHAYYRLVFSGFSSSGNDLAVSLIKHGPPHTSYGLSGRPVHLGTTWMRHSVYLRTENLTGAADDARLQFLLPGFAREGDVYWLDDISLEQIDAPPVPDAPRMLSPAPGASDQPFMVTLSWAAVDGADGYLVQLATDSLFASLICDSLVADTQVVVGPLACATCYYRRVRAANVGGYGAFTSVCSFTTLVAKTEPESNRTVPLQISLEQNYPNPFNPSTIIQYQLPEQTHVTLTVYNALGVQVAVVDEGVRSAGIHSVSFAPSGLASGSYFYTLRVDGLIETRKMMLVH